MGKKKKKRIEDAKKAVVTSKGNQSFYRSPKFWLIVIFTVSVILRIAYFLDNRAHNPFFFEPVNDAKVYYDWAKGLADGTWVQDKPYYMSPLYPYLLSAIFRIFGDSIIAVIIIQHIAGLISLYLVYLIARKVFGETPAIIALFLAAFHAPLVFNESKILLTTFTVLLYLLVIHLLLMQCREKPGLILSLAIGLIFGLAVVQRPNILLFAPLVVIWFFILHKKHLKSVIAMAALFTLGVVIPIIPVTAHNYKTCGEFVLLTTNTGVNFYYGANRDAAPTFTRREMISDSIINEEEKAREKAEAALGRKLNEKEISDYWMKEGFKQIRTRFGDWLIYEFYKIYWTINTFEIVNNYNLSFERKNVPVLNLFFIPFGVISLFGIVGIVLAAKREPKIILLLMYMATIFAGLLIFTVVSRFRIPITIILVGFAGYGITELQRLYKLRSESLMASDRYILAILTVVVLTPLTLYPYRSNTNPASTYYTLGILEYQKGNYDQAIKYQELSIEHYANADAYNNLASCYKKKKDYDKALEYYAKADETNPKYSASRFNAGLVYFELEQYGKAIPKFREAINIYPNYSRAKEKLAFSLVYTGQFDEAVSIFRELIAKEPGEPKHNFNLGAVFKATGNYAEARQQFETALQKKPDYTDAENALKNLPE
jgi:4-amino-4-deoxy-L-arabinose transferase-like glycosyltransferase/TolA-binding protein